jgi:hypothetical protein
MYMLQIIPVQSRHTVCKLQNILVQNRITVCNRYGIYQYRTDIPYATVKEYTGTEPTQRMQLLKNTPVQNRHTVCNC